MKTFGKGYIIMFLNLKYEFSLFTYNIKSPETLLMLQ
uniref:Uncharacterized protein n=1 Tax=Anguilla anguilla TaxID=7936 RepID=A0A0E9SBN2_ANGAN